MLMSGTEDSRAHRCLTDFILKNRNQWGDMVRLLRLLRTLDVYLAGASLVLLVGMTVVLIALRSVFSVSFVGSDELSRYLLICLVFLALPEVTRIDGHIKMRELAALLPPSWRKALEFVVAVSGFLSFGVVTVSTLENVLGNLGTVTPSLSMPYFLFFAPTLIGFLLVTVEYVVIVVRCIVPCRDPVVDRRHDRDPA